MPSVFGHGMFTMGLLGKALTGYVGVGNLETYQVRFTKQTWPGETLTTKVSIAKKYEEDGKQKVALECEVVNQDGEPKVQGSAVAALPSRADPADCTGGAPIRSADPRPRDNAVFGPGSTNTSS